MAIPKSYYNYFDVCKMEGIPEGTAKGALEKGLEGIASVEKLKPIAHLFKQFEKPVKGGMRKQYGIKRTHYDYYKKHGHAPKLSPGRPPKKGYTYIKATIPEDLKKEFQAVVDKANSMSIVHVTYSDAVAVALREWIDRRPQFKD